MTSKERVLQRERDRGRLAAQEVQDRATDMTGTELNAVEDRIPRFAVAVARQNMLTRKVGFVCKSTAGRVVKLLQNYDSSIYPQEPEELPAQWGFVWSKDPAKAQPFVAINTSPYMTGDCCIENGSTYRSKYDNNTAAPSAWPQGWEICEEEK